MQAFDRNGVAAPQCLWDQTGRRYRTTLLELFELSPGEAMSARVDMRQHMIRDKEIDRALERLFQHRCAFCERAVKTEPYRFRPIENAGPTSATPADFARKYHFYYIWLVNSWQNLFAICEECKPVEPSYFPVRGQRCALPSVEDIRRYVAEPQVTKGSWRSTIEEEALLIDPCEDVDFRRHFNVHPDGRLLARTRQARETIAHFNLNRPDLQAFRAGRYRLYATRLFADIRVNEGGIAELDFRNLECGGSWMILLGQLRNRLERNTRTLTRDELFDYYVRNRQAPGFREHFTAAFDDMEARSVVQDKETDRPARPGTTRPSRFVIHNYKAIARLDIRMPNALSISQTMRQAGARAPALVILGENAAGKSSILEAMAFSLSEPLARKRLGIPPQALRLNPKYMGAGDAAAPQQCYVEVHYEGESDPARVELNGDYPFISGANRDRIPVFAYGAFRHFLDKGFSKGADTPLISLFDRSFTLPNPEKWLQSIAGDKTLSTEVYQVLSAVLNIDQERPVIDFDEDGRCVLITPSGSDDPSIASLRTPLAAVSSGFMAVLAMICDVLRRLEKLRKSKRTALGETRAVVLIDEIEAHLHPRWKMRIIEGLRSALPEVTFIMTTHDPLCLRGLDTGEVRVFRRIENRQGDKSLPTEVRELDTYPAIGVLTIEQLLTSDLFDLHTTDDSQNSRSFARAADLLAAERDGGVLPERDRAELLQARQELGRIIRRALPVGSTDVERVVQEAMESYLVASRRSWGKARERLAKAARRKIFNALKER